MPDKEPRCYKNCHELTGQEILDCYTTGGVGRNGEIKDPDACYILFEHSKLNFGPGSVTSCDGVRGKTGERGNSGRSSRPRTPR